MKKTNSEERVLIGKAGSPAGIGGEFRITLYQHDSTNLKEGKVLLFEHTSQSVEAGGTQKSRAQVERVRYQKGRPVVKIEGIDDRTAAEKMTGAKVYIEAGDLEPLPEGEHYIRDLIGSRVFDISGQGMPDGDGRDAHQSREIGVLKDVIQNTAQSILEVETPEGKTVLIPAVDEFMRSIDESEGIIEVELIPGFLD